MRCGFQPSNVGVKVPPMQIPYLAEHHPPPCSAGKPLMLLHWERQPVPMPRQGSAASGMGRHAVSLPLGVTSINQLKPGGKNSPLAESWQRQSGYWPETLLFLSIIYTPMSVELFAVLPKHYSQLWHLPKQRRRPVKEEKRQQRGRLWFHAINVQSQCFALHVEKLC